MCCTAWDSCPGALAPATDSTALWLPPLICVDPAPLPLSSPQLRSNCSSDLPGWVPYTPPRPSAGGLNGLQIGLVVAGVCLLAACTALAAVLVLRWREQRRWQTLKGLDAELALVRRQGEARMCACWHLFA